MLPKKIGGIIPPVVTPLLDIDTLDVNGLERVLNRLIEKEVHGLFILGTTGEGPNLSHRIRKEIIKHTTTFVGLDDAVLASTDQAPNQPLARP